VLGISQGQVDSFLNTTRPYQPLYFRFPNMVRGVGKRGKQKRGGGRHFTKDMVLDEDGVAQSRRRPDDDDDDEEDSEEDSDDSGGMNEPKKVANDEEESSEEEDEEDEQPQASSSTNPPPKQVRIKKPVAAAPDAEEDPDLVNPNRVAMKNLKLSDVDAPRQMSRREK
jgi:hypothetical protein